MTRDQLNALLAYIEALIDEKLDDNSSADQGLISAIRARILLEELNALVEEEE